ncbi:unnamed protein product [Enterobius vermicularis]|uniref:Low-density lipoprotein receptor domain class A n=1 Tax=Enterobius vermicularis TaxID=51028 RepID=A0A0N4VMJ9_ENTVE|nr:unnamed protein product [Enterobius vermicularis]
MKQQLLYLFLFLAITTSTAVAQQQAKNSQCPANTFSCKDGSCIPLDWVGDGERDCDNGADESTFVKPQPKVFAANGTNKIFRGAKVAATQEDTVDDPFDQISTKTSPSPTSDEQLKLETDTTDVQPDSALLATERQAQRTECPSDVQLRISQCSEDFVEWSKKIATSDFVNKSALFDEER